MLLRTEGRKESLLGALPARRVNEAAIRESGEEMEGGEEEGRGGIERLAVLSPDAIEVQSGVVRVGEGGQDANPG